MGGRLRSSADHYPRRRGQGGCPSHIIGDALIRYSFCHDFLGNHSYIFDTQTGDGAALVGSFGGINEYACAHSFAELPNGNILATYQSKGDTNQIPGGLVELRLDGQVVQSGDADPGDPEIFVRPYGLVLLPDSDRVVVTTYDMQGVGLARHIQIWRLSDLSSLQTLPVPDSPTPPVPIICETTSLVRLV